jgi:hypothetical protein
VLLSNQKPKTIVAPAKSLIAAGTGQGGIVGRGVVQHQAVEDFALPGMGKRVKGKKRLRCRESHGFVALGRWRLFALTVEKDEPRVRVRRDASVIKKAEVMVG